MKKTKVKIGVSVALLLLGSIVLFLTRWLREQYDKVYFDQFLYQFKASVEGTQGSLVGSAIFEIGLYSVILTALVVVAYALLCGWLPRRLAKWSERYRQTGLCRFFQKSMAVFGALSLLLSCAFFITEFEVHTYTKAALSESAFIEQEYVDPRSVPISFDGEKRNLVYIFVESMESAFMDESVGGVYTPELAALARDNVSFSNTDGVGGALSYIGTTWTAAAMVSQTSGLPVKVPITARPFDGSGGYLPNAFSIGDVLKENGYRQVLLCGSNARFHGRRAYFEQHGNYEIVDTVTLKESGRLPSDYYEWWGFEDAKLFEYAKAELTRLSSSDEPFNLTLLTADTHFPDGYRCPDCQTEHKEQYANTLACSSRRIASFIEWMKTQPFYENTTIVLSGDHLTMDADFLDGLRSDYVRTTYTCFINAAVDTERTHNRQFGSFDLYPTTLAAMGATIEGDRLALGVNLFSDTPTLTERYGFDTVNAELQKRSISA